MSTLRRKMFFGAAWMMSVRLVDRGIGLASTVILARVLVPTDFGIVAMAMGVVALLELFSAFGLDTALIQRPEIGRPHYDTAWTFQVVFGAFIGLGLLALAWPAAAFYHQPALAWVLVVLATAPPIQGLENIGLVAFRRDLNFRAEFLIVTCKRLILFALTTSLALTLRSYWALVIGVVASRVLGVILSFIVHPYRPRLSLAERRELFGFSKWVLGTNLIAFALQRCPDVIIGRTLGPSSLGLYNVGSEIASLPASELVAPINRAVFPGFSRIAADRPALKHEYLTFIGLIAIIALPAAAGVASVAYLLVPLALGPNWLEAIGVVKVIALASTLQVMQTMNYAIYLAVGKPSRQVIVHGVQLVVLVPAMAYMSSRYGTFGAAQAFALCCACSFPVTLALVLAEVGGRLREFANVVWRPAMAAAVMYAALHYLAVPGDDLRTAHLALELVQSVALGATIYVAVVVISWLAAGKPDSTEASILAKLPGLLRRSTALFR